MATGGVANVIYSVPYRFNGLYTIGCIFFILNLVLFVFNVVMICCRFRYYPSTFLASILHPTESLFVPAWLISVGTILITITEYGTSDGKTGPWLFTTMRVLFWIYCGLAVLFSCGIYLVMWSTQTFTIHQMTPVWIFPAYPLLVIGPHAGILASKLHGVAALDIIIGGFVFQGIGFMVSLMIYAAFIYRLMTQKLPQESLRPGMFISIGPSGFTISAVVTMGQNMPRVVPANFMAPGMGELAGKVSLITANWMGLWLWGLAIWFFLVSVGAHWSTVRHGRGKFAMTFYSYIFPNTGTFCFLCQPPHQPRSSLCYRQLTLNPTSLNLCHLLHRQSLRLQTYQDPRLRDDNPTRHRLDGHLHHDDPRRHRQGHPLAAETRGPCRRRLEDSPRREIRLRSEEM